MLYQHEKNKTNCFDFPFYSIKYKPILLSFLYFLLNVFNFTTCKIIIFFSLCNLNICDNYDKLTTTLDNLLLKFFLLFVQLHSQHRDHA